MKIEINITEAEKNAIIDSLKQLEGLPPYDGFNSSKGDNYFAKSIEFSMVLLSSKPFFACGFASSSFLEQDKTDRAIIPGII